MIIETCLLNDEEKVKACTVSKMAGAHFVKTSTGFSTGGATLADVKLMRQTVGDSMGVKASGGIKDYKTAVAMIEAGANRLGTSSGAGHRNSERSADDTQLHPLRALRQDLPDRVCDHCKECILISCG